MELKCLDGNFTVCKIVDCSQVNLADPYCFLGNTDEENSLVCLTENVPANTIEREDSWKAFRIQGILDFSLIGVLSKISAILAAEAIGIFVVSTFNTDYIFVKEEQFAHARKALEAKGYIFR